MTPTEEIENHVATIKAIMNSYSLPSGAKVEIEAACEGLTREIKDWEDGDVEDGENDRYHDCIDEVESMPGHFVIVAKGMVEQERVEKLIESLKCSPYERALI